MEDLINKKMLVKNIRDLQLGKFAEVGREREYILLEAVINLWRKPIGLPMG